MARFTGGWVKIHRSLTEKDIIQNINLFAIWNYLLLIAVYKDSQLLWCGKQRILKPGSCVLGINQLAKQWDLSPRTISKWLHYLHSTGRIVLESCAVGTLVTICNWEEYQLIEEEVCAPTAHELRADCAPTARQVALSEEGKKERKKNGGIRQAYSPEFDQLWIQYGRRGHKQPAYEAYKKIQLPLDEIENLTKAIKNYCRKTPEIKFRLHFERFLKSGWSEWIAPSSGNGVCNAMSIDEFLGEKNGTTLE